MCDGCSERDWTSVILVYGPSVEKGLLYMSAGMLIAATAVAALPAMTIGGLGTGGTGLVGGVAAVTAAPAAVQSTVTAATSAAAVAGTPTGQAVLAEVEEVAAVEGPAIISKGAQVTEQVIRQAMKNAPLSSQQAGGVSLPNVQNYVDRLLNGELAPAIKVDGNIIVDGNQRYIAARILGQEPSVQSWVGGRPGDVVSWSDLPIDLVSW